MVDCKSICSFCSRMKRGRLYAAARREGYNVLALGQHLDDLAESFLMSTFHNGRLRSMKAHYCIKYGYCSRVYLSLKTISKTNYLFIWLINCSYLSV